jgi:nitroreductase
MQNPRKSRYKINELFINRWSPRAMSGAEISDEELMTLFEAARWAPSSFNGQPWRFLYAKRDTPSWKIFFDLLVPFNQAWTKNAAVLILVITRTTFEWNNKPERTHSFDAGAACENLALQGFLDGLVVHGMEGFDYDRAKEDLDIPEDYHVEAMFAVGKPGAVKNLSPELQERELPSDRKNIEEFAFEGKFPS